MSPIRGALELELRLLRRVEEDVRPVDEGGRPGANIWAALFAGLDAHAATAAGARDGGGAAGAQDLDPHPSHRRTVWSMSTGGSAAGLKPAVCCAGVKRPGRRECGGYDRPQCRSHGGDRRVAVTLLQQIRGGSAKGGATGRGTTGLGAADNRCRPGRCTRLGDPRCGASRRCSKERPTVRSTDFAANPSG